MNAVPAKFAYSIPEFQQLGGPCKANCYALEKAGKLTLTKIGRNTVILHAEAERYFASLPTYAAVGGADVSKAVAGREAQREAV